MSLFACMLLLSLLIIPDAMSQQPKHPRPASPAPEQIINGPINDTYTYRLFVAPNKVFGYDILRNGRIIFHQPALAEPAGNKEAALNKKSKADKAATLAIEKIKMGMPAELTREELMQITAH